MMNRYEESIADCEAVLKLQPYHFGAASGMGLCYIMLSKDEEAIKVGALIPSEYFDVAQRCGWVAGH